MSVMPQSIITYEAEKEWLDSDLDLAYVDELAASLAAILRDNGVAEAAYQPGDGTRYSIVIIPLSILRPGTPRVKDGVTWDRHAVSGMKSDSDADPELPAFGYYHQSGYLLCLVEKSCYPIRLEGRGPDSGIAASYIAEHWNLPHVSACSIAVLVRAICFHLAHG